ncbi:leucine-rich repeat and IQ domain-containing protein 1 [Clarias magur]|uniref:Leucine-rich repeat and IQ domain-containing protein 1 n=1 Tax=Clarias magur TaxID=1594786 RepID=A0A8J4ULA4_CLAMG|nr:leucine-rich repeat and IQ domain-containing protein 1 [Clarias magur]
MVLTDSYILTTLMDAHDIEQAIEKELEKVSGNHSDMGSDSDTDIEEDFSSSNGKLESDLPDSVLSYFKVSSNRVNTLEQLILEDLDDLEIMCNEMFSVSQHADLLNGLGSDFEEDPLKQKEIIMSEIEEQLGSPCETYDCNEDNDTEYDTHKDSERQLMFEWRQMEERLKKEEEQRQAELEAEKELCLKLEETRRCRNEQFKERISRTEATNQSEFFKAEEEDGEISQSVEVEMVKQQELIKRLEDQIVEERRAFEEVQQKEAKRTEARCAVAATKIQAAFRGALVRHWSKKELTKRREEERRKHEEKKEREWRREMEEVVKMEREKERRRVEQEQQHHSEEAERRRAEYERAKEQERHRLERERKLEEQRRKEMEEAKRIEDENKRREEENQKRVGEMRIEDGMKKVQEVEEKKNKEEENAKRIKDELKREEEKKACARVEERRLEEDRRKGQQHMEKKGKEKGNVTEEEIKNKGEKESPEMMEDGRIREVSREVHDDKETSRKEEEKSKAIDEGIKIKEEKERRAKEEEKKRKAEKARRIEDESKIEEVENQNSMEFWVVEREKSNVQVDGDKKMEKMKEAKRTEHEKNITEEEKHKQIKERRRKQEKEENQSEAEIIRKEKEENQKMNEKRVEENIRLKQNEQVKGNQTEQRVKEQRKKNEIIGEQLVMMRNDDGQNSEVMNRNLNADSVKGLFEQRENIKTDKESRKTIKRVKGVKFSDIPQECLSQSVNIPKSFLAKTLSPTNGQDEQMSSHLVSTLPSMSSENSSVSVGALEKGSVTDTGGLQCALHDSSVACLPDSTEQKRLAWMMNCTPWVKLSMQSKRNGLSAPPRRREHKRASGHSPLPLPVDIILRSGPWSSLIQVTSVTLEDLSSCRLSTLSECTKLQSLTLRRCRLQALEGLNQCTQLQHIDLQENSITYVDCGGLARLEVLLLGRNQLTSIHGLGDAVNLTVLQLSYNIISRISGLGSLKKLHRLTVDHNQLISTRGLSEAFTLLHVDCSYNHLSHVEGLENCALLNTLDLRGNNLTELPVLENHVLLRELYLDDNNICSLHGLDSFWLPLLRCLSVPQNSITQLPLLVDLLSLKTFNVSHNCLSELSNICMSLQGCSHLQELSISDNPVQQDSTWRSSVLAVNPSLIKLNGEQTGASRTLSADSTQLWSFQALCQAHQEQIDSVLQRHGKEISSSPSALHAQLLVGKHTAELFQLAENQRYDHEYGGSRVCETATQEPVPSSHLQELSECDLAEEKSAEVKDQQPEEHKSLSWQAPCLPNFTPQSQSPSGDHNAGCGGRCLSPTQKFSNTQPGEDRHSKHCAHPQSRMDLKTVAVMVIQRCWREHRQKKRTGDLGPPAKAHARLRPRKELRLCKSRPECLNKDCAATIIQAVWRGYSLRKRLTRALMLAQISDGDEAFEEVDIDEFVFDEEAMERDWNTLRFDMSLSSVLPYLEQLPLPKPLLPLPELHKKISVQPWKTRQAWISGEEAPVSEQSQSPDSCARSPASTSKKYSLSERSEKILKEWGFSNSSTALLMLKRAQRMKTRKQQHQRKVQDPAVHLALFRKHNVRPVEMTNHESRLEFREELKAGRGNLSVQEAMQVEPGQKQTLHRTYQWLQTHAVLSQRSSAPSMRLLQGAEKLQIQPGASGLLTLVSLHFNIIKLTLGHARLDIQMLLRNTSNIQHISDREPQS